MGGSGGGVERLMNIINRYLLYICLLSGWLPACPPSRPRKSRSGLWRLSLYLTTVSLWQWAWPTSAPQSLSHSHSQVRRKRIFNYLSRFYLSIIYLSIYLSIFLSILSINLILSIYLLSRTWRDERSGQGGADPEAARGGEGCARVPRTTHC